MQSNVPENKKKRSGCRNAYFSQLYFEIITTDVLIIPLFHQDHLFHTIKITGV